MKTIEGMDTRPTTDRIKETLFNMLQNDVPGSYFLDLFAGSGQIGLEAVSRGARYAVFVENNKKACTCIEDNIHFTKFDVIFMDPPYKHEYEKEVLECLKDSSILKEDTLIIVEASLDTSFDYLSELGFTLKKLKTYKTNVHAFITKAE